jgi:hypothetical protein
MKKFLLKKIFNSFKANNIDYLVLRKQEQIPDKVTYDNDLDLLCKRAQRKKIKSIFLKNHYNFYQDSETQNVYLYGAKPHDHFLNKKNDLHIDIVYSLSYRSPNKGEWVSVDKEIQIDIWNQLIVSDKFWRYKPSAQDELIHILCHCIFDKRKIDKYYKSKIQELLAQVDSALLEKKLSLIFFDFSPKLIEYILNNDTDNIFLNYISFKEY